MRALSRARRMDDRGNSAVEYVLLVSFITMVILTSLTAFGQGIERTFLNSCNEIALAIQPGSSC